MVIGLGSEPTRQEGEEFLADWPRMMEQRLRWFQDETAGAVDLDGSTASLEPALAWVADRVGAPHHIDLSPAWFGPAFSDAGWTPYGGAAVEGLTAYLDRIYRHALGDAATWELETDPQSPNLHRPVPKDRRIPPAWIQVRTAQAKVRRGAAPDRLRRSAESVLSALSGLHDSPQHAGHGRPTQVEEPWVSLAPAGRRRWQVTFPDDVDQRLGNAYPDLEDLLNAVSGVTEAIMEDRDCALVTADRGVTQDDLEQRLEEAVAGLDTTLREAPWLFADDDRTARHPALLNELQNRGIQVKA